MGTAQRAVAATLACAAAVGGLTACGGKDGTGSNANHPTQQQRLVAAMNAFAKCARTHGVPVPDADPNGQIPGIEALERKYVHTPQGQSVLRGCQRELTAARQLNDAANAGDRKDALRFARCMRAHGIPIPDPGPSGETAQVPRKIDKASPQVRAAAAACGSPVPQRVVAR
jgi:hypothetical protein